MHLPHTGGRGHIVLSPPLALEGGMSSSILILKYISPLLALEVVMNSSFLLLRVRSRLPPFLQYVKRKKKIKHMNIKFI